jgi:glyoxylate reductase
MRSLSQSSLTRRNGLLTTVLVMIRSTLWRARIEVRLPCSSIHTSTYYRRGSEGIRVSNTPKAVDIGTATTTLYLLISALRQFSIAERNIRSGKWNSGLSPAHDSTAKTLGILGMGGIGQRFGEMAQALPMKKIYYHNRKPKADAPAWAEYVADLEEFLEKSDVLSIHCPLNEQTVGLIGEKEIATLKKGSIIINTARGKVINEAALVAALKSGHVRHSTLLGRLG